MPASIKISLIVALIGAATVAILRDYLDIDGVSPDYASVALSFFNASAILYLFVILYRSEKQSLAQIGKVIRDNIATVAVALLINLVDTIAKIVRYLQ